MGGTYLGEDITHQIKETNGLFLYTADDERLRIREVMVTQVPDGEEDLMEGDLVKIFDRDPYYMDGKLFFRRDQIINWSPANEA